MVEDKYFKLLVDLDGHKIPISEDKHFKLVGDLEQSRGKENDFFKPAGDLDGSDRKSVEEDKYFKPLGDVNKNMTKEEIDEYLLTVVSGKRYPHESEMGKVVGAASTVVSIDEVKRMVSEGYNIVSAECINSNMIIVEFQCFDKSNNVGRGR